MRVKIICPSCRYSREIPEERIPSGVCWATCPQCRHRFQFARGELAAGGLSSSSTKDYRMTNRRIPSPWERRSELGAWTGISRTSRAVLFSPTDFFSHMAVDGGFKEPLAFGLLIGSIGMMLEVFWEFLLVGESISSIGDDLFGSFGSVGIFLGITAFCPVLLLFAIFTTSVLLHLLLRLVRGGGNGFEATFRVICFSQATQLWAMIPFVGGFIGVLWLLVVQMIGLKEIHGTSYLRLALALILPLILVLVLLVIVLVPDLR